MYAIRSYYEAKLFGFFVGQVMKETKGKANPKIVNEIFVITSYSIHYTKLYDFVISNFRVFVIKFL